MYIGLFGTPSARSTGASIRRPAKASRPSSTAPATALPAGSPARTIRRATFLIVAHGGVLLVLAALTGVDLHTELRRNATPILFQRASGGWEATAAG